MKTTTLISVLFLFNFMASSYATHLGGGVITYKQIDNYTIEASVFIYTNFSGFSENGDSTQLCWGDEFCQNIPRTNGNDLDLNGVPDGEVIDEFTLLSIYTWQHTYAEQGQFTLSFSDPSRSAGIININFHNSDMVSFHVETQFNLVPLSNGVTNQSPVILEPPIIRAFEGLPYIYTPNAYDIDGDSIVYQRAIPLMNDGTPVPNYQWPEQIDPSGDNLVTFDMKKGTFYWTTPQVSGEYVIAYLIQTYHDGELVDQMNFEFTIFVEDDPDFIPEIEIENVSIDQVIPVNVGDTMWLEVTAFDPDINQEIEITSSSGLYDYFTNPATFEVVENGNEGTAIFEWIVLEEHVRQQPYQVVVKVSDNDSMYSKTNLVVVCYQFEEFITGINDPEYSIDFQLFPNPAGEGFIHLVVKNNNLDLIGYSIHNSLGQPVKSGNISSELTPIDVRSLTPGVYFLQIGNNEIKAVKTFVVE